jgi:hypothetical protein
MSWFKKMASHLTGKHGAGAAWTVPGISFDTDGWTLDDASPDRMSWSAPDASMVVTRDVLPDDGSRHR